MKLSDALAFIVYSFMPLILLPFFTAAINDRQEAIAFLAGCWLAVSPFTTLILVWMVWTTKSNKES